MNDENQENSTNQIINEAVKTLPQSTVPMYGDSQPAEPDTAHCQKIIVQSGNVIIYKIIAFTICGLILVAGILFASNALFNFFHKPNIDASVTQMENPAEVKKLIELKSGFIITDPQAVRISQTQKDSTPGVSNYKVPEQILINVCGNEVEKKAEEFRKQTGGNVVVTTDPNKPNEVPKINKTQQYTLEQRSYKLFPDHEIGFTGYTDGSSAVDYTNRIKVFGAEAYLGASVMYDKPQHNGKIGIRIAFPK